MIAVQIMNEDDSKNFAETGDSFFSFSYFLRAMASRRRENDIIPVKKCDIKETKENKIVKNRFLGSLEEIYFIMKSNEKRKKM